MAAWGATNGSDKNSKNRTKKNGSSETVTEAAEGEGGFRSCLIDHKDADI